MANQTSTRPAQQRVAIPCAAHSPTIDHSRIQHGHDGLKVSLPQRTTPACQWLDHNHPGVPATQHRSTVLPMLYTASPTLVVYSTSTTAQRSVPKGTSCPRSTTASSTVSVLRKRLTSSSTSTIPSSSPTTLTTCRLWLPVSAAASVFLPYLGVTRGMRVARYILVVEKACFFWWLLPRRRYTKCSRPWVAALSYFGVWPNDVCSLLCKWILQHLTKRALDCYLRTTSSSVTRILSVGEWVR